MFHGISHVDVQVVDLDKARHLWADIIGFSVNREGEGFTELDSGNMAIRLIQVPSIEQTATLRLSVANVAEAYQHLL